MKTMGTPELRSDLHKILDTIEDEQLLRTIYDFLKQENFKGGEIWGSLTDDQKKEIYASYEESQDDGKLVSWQQMRKKY